MSAVSWKDSLRQAITRLEREKKRPLRLALLGIGHELRGDDAAGLAVARRLRPLTNDRFLVIEAGHAPENHTSPLRRFKPDLVLLVDCAQLNEKPGAIRWLPWQETTGLSASTHTMPPYILASYLTMNSNCEVDLIGIQPASTTLDSTLSIPAEKAVKEIVSTMKASLAAPYTLGLTNGDTRVQEK